MSGVIAYLRVSTEEQGESGAGLAAQRRAILAEAEKRGWENIEWVEEVVSTKLRRRPALERILERLKAGEAQVLCTAKCDRLCRSLLEFAGIMATARKEGWTLVALDCPVDLTTPTGEAMASVMAVFAQLERRLIGERTRNALAERRAQGVQLGRRRSEHVPGSVRARIAAEHARGASYAAIARTLNDEGVQTAHGGRLWYAQTVRRMALQVTS